MKKIKKIIGTTILAGLVLFLSAGLSTAAYITQTQSYTSSSPILTFNTFDDSLGTLDSVWLYFDMTTSGGYQIWDNDGLAITNATAEFGASVQPTGSITMLLGAYFPDVEYIASVTETGINIGADNGDESTPDFTMPQNDVYQLLGSSEGVSITDEGYVADANEYLYTKSQTGPTFTVNMDPDTFASLSGGGSVQYTGDSPDIGGDFTVKYEYTSSSPVPEPSAMLLFGFGLVGLLGIGKKKLGK